MAEFIVTDRVDGFFIEPFDIKAMATCIADIAQSDERTEIADRALESARRFDIDTVGRKWQRLFDDCVQRD